MPEFERPDIANPTSIEIAEFHKKHGMKKIVTLEEINRIKIDFVRSITDQVFKSKSEVIEVLKDNMYVIDNLKELERTAIRSMIIAGNIPKELIEKKPEEIKEIHECNYKCPTCNEQMFDIWSFKRTSYGRNIISHTKTRTKETVEYELKQIPSPNEFQVICLNRECPRYSKLLDKEIVK